jgi:hypothetical protein
MRRIRTERSGEGAGGVDIRFLLLRSLSWYVWSAERFPPLIAAPRTA